jgi:hypothetical protein
VRFLIERLQLHRVLRDPETDVAQVTIAVDAGMGLGLSR